MNGYKFADAARHERRKTRDADLLHLDVKAAKDVHLMLTRVTNPQALVSATTAAPANNTKYASEGPHRDLMYNSQCVALEFGYRFTKEFYFVGLTVLFKEKSERTY